MTAEEKRNLLVKSALTREKKNTYSQDAEKRIKIESGYGDCSGTVWYWYHKLFGINIGGNTEAQINSKLGTRVDMTITDGIPDESKLQKGDLLYFRGSDNSRTEGVGHVEMYIGNGQCFGHGSGTGGTVKNLASYCKYRQSLTSTTKLKNKGFICAIRFIADDPVVVKPVETKPVETKKEDEPMTEQERKKFNEVVNICEKLVKENDILKQAIGWNSTDPNEPALYSYNDENVKKYVAADGNEVLDKLIKSGKLAVDEKGAFAPMSKMALRLLIIEHRE